MLSYFYLYGPLSTASEVPLTSVIVETQLNIRDTCPHQFPVALCSESLFCNLLRFLQSIVLNQDGAKWK